MYRWVWLKGWRTRMKLEHSFWKRNEISDIKYPQPMYDSIQMAKNLVYAIPAFVYIVILPV